MSTPANNFPPVGTKLRFTKDFFKSTTERKGNTVTVLNIGNGGFQTTNNSEEGQHWVFVGNWQEGLEIAPTPPTITIPKVLKPTSGLSQQRGRYYAVYYVDGKIKIKSLKTTNPEEAQTARDQFYAELRKQGAVDSGDLSTVDKSGDFGIYERKPFTVKIRGKFIGDYQTRQEAIEARNKYLAD